MIVVLKGADFSASNIGQIDLPIDEYRELSKRIFSVYSGHEFTSEEMVAIERFSRGLVKNNLLSKIGFLSLPVLCSTLAENNINLIESGYVINYAATDSYYKITAGKGLSRSNALPGGYVSRAFSITHPDCSDMFVLLYNTTTFPAGGIVQDSNEAYKAYGGMAINEEKLYGMSRTWIPDTLGNPVNPIFLTGNGHTKDGDVNFANVVGPMLYNSNNGEAFMAYNGQAPIYQDEGYVGTYLTDGNSYPVAIPCSPYKDSDNNFGSLSIGAICLGTHLTAGESLALQSLFTTLMNAL